MLIAASSPAGADINTQASDSASALYEACKNEHESVVEFLLSQGADANKANKDGMLPLHIASRKGNYRSAPGRPAAAAPPTPGGPKCPAHRTRQAQVREEGTCGGSEENGGNSAVSELAPMPAANRTITTMQTCVTDHHLLVLTDLVILMAPLLATFLTKLLR